MSDTSGQDPTADTSADAERLRVALNRVSALAALRELSQCLQDTDIQYTGNGDVDVAATFSELQRQIEHRISQLKNDEKSVDDE